MANKIESYKVSVPLDAVSKQTISQIKEQINGRTEKQLGKVQDDYSLLLKKVALNFWTTYKKKYEVLKGYQQRAFNLQQKRHQLVQQAIAEGHTKKTAKWNDIKSIQKYAEIYKNYQQSQDINIQYQLRDFLKASLEFNDKILQIIQGHPVLITIVIPQSQGPPIIKSLSLSALLRKNSGITLSQTITSGSPRLSGTLNFNINKIKNKKDKAASLGLDKKSREYVSLYQSYGLAIKDFHNSKHNGYVYWKQNETDPWSRMKVVGKEGDLAQAYALFYYQSKIWKDVTPKWTGLAQFMEEGVSQVDNVSGLYTSDISGETYDFAVKSLNASLPGYIQMLGLARDILNGKYSSKELLKEKSESQQWTIDEKSGEKIRKGLRNYMQKEINGVFRRLDK